jgi:hypothetical protein
MKKSIFGEVGNLAGEGEGENGEDEANSAALSVFYNWQDAKSWLCTFSGRFVVTNCGTQSSTPARGLQGWRRTLADAQ